MILGTVELGMNYGINNIGGKPSRKQAYRLLDRAWNGGIRELDTAVAYGESEEIIGEYQKLTGHKFMIDTKLPTIIEEHRYNECFAAACNKLRTDTIYLFYLHSFKQCENKSLLEFLQELKKENRIDHIGVSIYEPKEMLYIIDRLPFVDTIQFPYNILDNYRWRKKGLLKKAHENGKRLCARSIYLQGLIFKDSDDSIIESMVASEYIREIQSIADDFNMTVAETAYRYVAENSYIDDVIVGCQTEADVIRNLNMAAVTRTVNQKMLRRIEAVSEQVSDNIIDPRKWDRR